jgi:hypothetical protein
MVGLALALALIEESADPRLDELGTEDPADMELNCVAS